jgi:uncharacterized protein (DUF4213/DUF364 family)
VSTTSSFAFSRRKEPTNSLIQTSSEENILEEQNGIAAINDWRHKEGGG